MRTELLLLYNSCIAYASKSIKVGRSKKYKRGVADSSRDKAMVTVKSSQKIFTDAEIASLTGICVDHIQPTMTRYLEVLRNEDDEARS